MTTSQTQKYVLHYVNERLGLTCTDGTRKQLISRLKKMNKEYLSQSYLDDDVRVHGEHEGHISERHLELCDFLTHREWVEVFGK